MDKIQLSKEPISTRLITVKEAIASRRSKRDFSGHSMSLAELSDLLYYSDGITDKRHGLRAAPSAGGTYPIEIYTLVNNITGIPKGIYHYLVSTHELELIKEGNFSHDISSTALREKMIILANVVIILTAVFQRIQRRYGDRAKRYIYMEAGHIAQNACLMATSMDLGACAIGAFYDQDLNRILEIDGIKESALYIIAVGKI